MKLTTLVDLGAETLPTATHSIPNSGRWFPVTSPPPPVAPVTAIDATPVADGVLLEWEAVESGGAVVVYLVERSDAPTGPWTEVARTTETRYLYSDGSGRTWYFRITPTVRGQAGPSGVIEGAPDAVTARLVEVQTRADQAVAEAARAELAAADALLLMGTAYSGQAEYAAGDVVHIDGRMYRAAKQVPLETPPPAPGYWSDIGTVTEAQGATMSAVQQMRVDVNESGQEIAALTQRVGSSETNVTQLMEVQGSASVLPLRNPGFEQPPVKGVLPGWSNSRPDTTNSPTALRDGVYSIEYSGAHTGARVVRFGHSAANSGLGVPGFVNHLGFYNDRVLPVSVGDRIQMSFWTRVTQRPVTGATIRPYLHWIDESGSRFDYTVGGIRKIPIANHDWHNNIMPAIEVPAGAVGVCISIITGGGTLPVESCYIYFDDIRLERLSVTEGQMVARHTVSLDVNGNVSGTISENDGERSSFSVLANVFRVLAPGEAAGMEWQDKYIRVYGSGYQLVMGAGFGSGSNLVQWFGPNIGAAACTIANCIEAKTTSGQTIIRGSNSQGRLEFTNTLVQVFDAKNKLRVRMGVW